MPTREQKLEAYFRLYWADIHEWKKSDLCRASGLPDSSGLLRWDELSPAERAAIRAEVVRRLNARVSVDQVPA